MNLSPYLPVGGEILYYYTGMATPIETLITQTDPKVLATFEKAYHSPLISSGACSRCGALVNLTDQSNHFTWHKQQAKQMWVLASAALAPEPY